MDLASQAQIAERAGSLGKGSPENAGQVRELSSENMGSSISEQVSFQRYRVAVITTWPEGEFKKAALAAAKGAGGTTRRRTPVTPLKHTVDRDLTAVVGAAQVSGGDTVQCATSAPRSAQRNGTPVGSTLVSLRESPLRIPTPAWKDEDLVEECLRGNEHAWAAVVEKYKKLVYSAPMKYHMSPRDTADVFQEVWLDLFTQLGSLRKPGALRSWLISVATHKCFQWKRRRIRMAEQPAGEFDREPVAKRSSSPGGRSRRRS